LNLADSCPVAESPRLPLGGCMLSADCGMSHFGMEPPVPAGAVPMVNDSLLG